MYLAIFENLVIAKEETREELAAALAYHYGHKIAMEDNGESISMYVNGKKCLVGWVSQQSDKLNGYSMEEATNEAYGIYLNTIKQTKGLEIYSTK